MKKDWIIVFCVVITVFCLSSEALCEAETESSPKVYLKNTEPRVVAIMKHKGPYTEIAGVITKLLGEIEKGKDHHMIGPVMCIFYNSPKQVAEKDLSWEVMVPVVNPGDMNVVDQDVLGFRYLNPFYVAYIYHVGPYDAVDESYNTLLAWAERNKYEAAGYPMEIYWNDPDKTPKEKLITEIWFPVKEKKAREAVK